MLGMVGEAHLTSLEDRSSRAHCVPCVIGLPFLSRLPKMILIRGYNFHAELTWASYFKKRSRSVRVATLPPEVPPMNFPLLAGHVMLLVIVGACSPVNSSGVSLTASPGVLGKPGVQVSKPVSAPGLKAPDSAPSGSVTSGQGASVPIKATDVYLNHFCLLSDHTNLCSRTNMQPDPGHSLKLEPMNGTGQTLTGTLVIEFDASKIELAVDGNLRHSVKRTTTAFEKSPGKLTIRNFVVQPGKDYQYLWDRVKPNASGLVMGKATFSWRQDNQIKYAMGCYEFNLDAVGGNDNILGLEKSKFNGYSGMDCGSPSIPE
jgi:hypothetical protein